MSESNPVGGLKWVEGEIGAGLRRVRACIETFAEGPRHGGELEPAAEALNEIRGVLAALQLSGPFRLVEEMQAVCAALENEAVPDTDGAAEALMLSIIQLPDYLAQLQAGRPDAPLALLPAINDLRVCRGTPALTEAELLVPTSVLTEAETPSPEVQDALAKVAARVRPHFHRYLLLWLKPETSSEGLANLVRLFHQLRQYVRDGIFHELFLAAEAVGDALAEGSISSSPDVKALISHVDRVIKPFVEHADAWPEDEAQALLADLLSLIAHCDSKAYLVGELRRAYGLVADQGGGDLDFIARPAPEAMSAMIGEARKELLPIKDALDLYARGPRERPETLAELEPLVLNLANTLVVTGADSVVECLRDCGRSIAAMAAGTVAADDARLMAVAEELLAVEATLAELQTGAAETEIRQSQKRQLLVYTLKEAKVEIVRAEQAISELTGDPSDLSALKEVPALFQRVSGSLRMIAENDAAEVLEQVVEQIRQRYLATHRNPAPEELDLLARTISAVELYLDGLAGGESYRKDLITEARTALQDLALAAPFEYTESREEPSPPPEAAAGTTSVIDQEFLEIFLEEAQEEEQTIREQFASWSRNEDDEVALTTLRRAFHTLKGSGRLVGAERTAEVARAVEGLLNRVIDHSVGVTPSLVSLVGEAVAFLPGLIEAEADGRIIETAALVASFDALASEATPEPAALTEDSGAAPAKVIPWPVSSPPARPEAAVPEPSVDDEAAEAAELAGLAEVDDELIDIFRGEARDHLRTLEELAASGEAGADLPDALVLRALHTLTGSARMTGLDSFAGATAALERLFQRHRERRVRLGEPALGILSRTVDALALRLEHLPGGGNEIAALRHIAREALRLAEEITEAAAAEEEPVGLPDSDLEALGLGPGPAPPVGEPRVPEAPAGPDEGPAPAIELPEAEAEKVSEGGALSEAEPEELVGEGAVLEPESEPPSYPSATEAPEAPSVAEAPEAPEAAPAAEVPGGPEAEATPEVPELEPTFPEAAGPAPAAGEDEEAPPLEPGLETLPKDAELIGLFLEDARDLLDKLEQALRALQLAPSAQEPVVEQQRLLHTLKGSARLSGLTSIGDLSHAFESLLTAFTKGEARVDDDALELAQRTLDTLGAQVDAVEQGRPLTRAADLIQDLAYALETRVAGPTEPRPQVAAMGPSAPLPTRAEERPAPPAEQATAPSAARIRVRADRLDRLVDHAGEISIYRSRLAQNSGQLGFHLEQLDQTVARLREQLRQLEIETETQIIHGHERYEEALGSGREVFDPLELDRYSNIQQLSRSLAETVNDLVSLRTLMGDLHGQSETLLLQQSRIAEELQDGLLRTRMVPFAQLVPRLHRLVRQTAEQTGRRARLEVLGADTQLDRSIQERLLAPLEHLLRNAVGHGIEPPEARTTAGKEPEGRVSLAVSREGNDAVVRVSDDGGGLDLESIRRRAVERGLLAPDEQPGDEEIAQLVLTSGFSTAEEVTQIAGRGVGLDVVNAEVRQLSGSLTLESEPGRGTAFTVRLPLTLALVEALLVQLGGEVYAVPHMTIEGAARIARQDLEACFGGGPCDFAYGGQDYRVVHLGSLLQPGATPELGERRWLAVLLARVGDQRVAFHVDNLIGSQRIVVKPLGPELGSIRWLSGGTILPDGRVALILDLLALIRSGAVHHYRPPQPADEAERQAQICVMVVDDSLTVRRVTTRLLQRHEIDVIAAQDGVEALAMLEERVPDLILLDVEMPRMDGYELTRHIRRSPRLKSIPIVMITSRTGEKHRRYAAELGIDRYLGKPYHETELLDEIGAVLMERGP
jgi:chemosensory pili system protein ChpA (sensor histidine kinase/response regulator)